jgi:hypothetical protein
VRACRIRVGCTGVPTRRLSRPGGRAQGVEAAATVTFTRSLHVLRAYVTCPGPAPVRVVIRGSFSPYYCAGRHFSALVPSSYVLLSRSAFKARRGLPPNPRPARRAMLPRAAVRGLRTPKGLTGPNAPSTREDAPLIPCMRGEATYHCSAGAFPAFTIRPARLKDQRRLRRPPSAQRTELSGRVLDFCWVFVHDS